MATLITIPGCTVTHVLGETAVELSSGDLTLVASKDTSIAAPANPDTQPAAAETALTQTPILTLTVGTAAFPLYAKTLFGTQAHDSRLYLFSPEIGPPGAGRGGFIQITMPDGVQEEGSELAKLQEEFESVLIKHGLLQEGLAAAADELAMGAKEGAAQMKENIDSATQDHLDRNPPTSSPTAFSNRTHTILDGAAYGTQSAAEVTKSISNSIGGAMASAGAWVGKQIGVSGSTAQEPTPGTANTEPSTGTRLKESAQVVAGGVVEAATSLSESLSSGTHKVVENDYGTEAAHVTSATGETLSNTASTVGNTLAGTSVLVQGGNAVGGGMEEAEQG